MVQTNLRELLVTDEIGDHESSAAAAPWEVVPVGKGVAIYAKLPEVPVYVIGSEGENILQITKPLQVIVPPVRYELGDAGEAAIQERIVALIEAASGLGPPPPIRLENISKYLGKNMKKPLAAILGDEAAVERLALAMPSVKVYVSPLPLGRRVYGLPEPKYLGRIAVNSTKGTHGLLIHGRPVSVDAQLEGVPNVELATPRDIGRRASAN